MLRHQISRPCQLIVNYALQENIGWGFEFGSFRFICKTLTGNFDKVNWLINKKYVSTSKQLKCVVEHLCCWGNSGGNWFGFRKWIVIQGKCIKFVEFEVVWLYSKWIYGCDTKKNVCFIMDLP